MLSLSTALRRTGTVLLDLVLPPRCIACGEEVDAVNALCVACWRKVTFLGEPCCACCGLPFDHDLGAGALCGACAEARPAYDRARSALRYDDGSRGLILAFKHGDRLHGAPAFGDWMRRAGAALLADADLLMPVPLHWTRLLSRRYNQAALLAHAIHRADGPRVAPTGSPAGGARPPKASLAPRVGSATSAAPFASSPGNRSGTSRSSWWTMSSPPAPRWRNARAS